MLVALAVALGILAGCSGEPASRWEQRGFETEADCWTNHGWEGTDEDAILMHRTLDYWCGPER